jgi:hypothetical protein
VKILFNTFIFISSLFSYFGFQSAFLSTNATAYEYNSESIISRPDLEEEQTYPEIHQELANNLSEVSYSKLFWQLTSFTKETGIKILIIDDSFEPAVMNLSDDEINEIINSLERLKPYAIALNLNRTHQKVKSIKLYQHIKDKSTRAYNTGDKFVVQLRDLRLNVLLHELLHSVDPFSESQKQTRTCMKMVLGDNVFSIPRKNLVKIDKFFMDHITANYDGGVSIREGFINSRGYFLECFAMLGETVLRVSSDDDIEEREELFNVFMSMIGVNSSLYTTPEFNILFKDLIKKGRNISIVDANDFSYRFREYWDSLHDQKIPIHLSSDLKNQVYALQEQGISMGRQD